MKLYPSQYTPMVGSTTGGNYKESCLRYISVKHLIRERGEIHPLYQAIGLIAEERIMSSLPEDMFISREVPVQFEAGDGVMISGRADIVGPDFVIESKATLSSSKRAQWRKGNYSPEHLGQLVTYMVALKRNIGWLRCSYAHFSKDSQWLGFEEFSWHVRIDGSQIFVEGLPIDTTLFDIFAFYTSAKHALIGADLPPKPITDNPCRTCPFSKVCTSNPQDRENFVRQVQHVIDEGFEPVGGPNPTIKRHDRKGVVHE